MSNTVTTYTSVGNREDLINKVYLISPSDTPFMSDIATTDVEARYHEWQTDSLGAVSSIALVEGADAVYSAQAPTVRIGNNTQIIGDAFQVSNTQEAVSHAGPNELARAQIKTLKSLKKAIEFSAVLNTVPVTGSTSTARQMRGVLGWNATNYFGGTGFAAPVYGQPGSAPVAGTPRLYTEDLLQQAMQAQYTAGGNVNVLYVTPAGKGVQDKFSGGVTRMQDVNKDTKVTLNTTYTIYGSAFGNVTIKPNRVLAGHTNAVFGIDTDMWAMGILRAFDTKEMAVTGDSRKFQIIWEGTLEARNEASSFTIADLSNV